MKSNIPASALADDEQEYLIKIYSDIFNVEKVETRKLSNFLSLNISVNFQQNLWATCLPHRKEFSINIFTVTVIYYALQNSIRFNRFGHNYVCCGRNRMKLP